MATKRRTRRKRRQGKRPWLLSASSWVVLAVTIGIWVVQEGVGEHHWFSALLTYLPQIPFLVLPIVFALASILKRRIFAFIPASLACLIVLFVNMGLQVRISSDSTQAENTLTVLTWNIKGGERGMDAIIQVIRDTNADVVCLQEYTGLFGGKQAEGLFRASLPEFEYIRQGELVTLVKGKPLRTRSVSIRDSSSGGYRRNALEVSIQHGGRRVSILNVHLTTSITGESLFRRTGTVPAYLEQATQVRSEQFSNIIEWQKLAEGLTIVAGDFNTPPRGRLYRRMTNHSRDSFADVGGGFGYTYRADIPLLRIDYVFAGGGLEPENCWVVRSQASDHLPVVSILRASR